MIREAEILARKIDYKDLSEEEKQFLKEKVSEMSQHEIEGITVWGKLKFSNNWNGKLLTNSFTTIRKLNKFYVQGACYEVQLNNTTVKIARLQSIENVNPRLLTEREARLDAGMSKHDLLELLTKFYGTVTECMALMTFVTVKDIAAQRVAMLEAELRKAQQLTAI